MKKSWYNSGLLLDLKGSQDDLLETVLILQMFFYKPNNSFYKDRSIMFYMLISRCFL